MPPPLDGAEFAGLPDGVRILFGELPLLDGADCGVIGLAGGFGVKPLGPAGVCTTGGWTGIDCSGLCAGSGLLKVAGSAPLPSGLVDWTGVKLAGVERCDLMSMPTRRA